MIWWIGKFGKYKINTYFSGMKTKKVTITLTSEQQEKARVASKKVLGKENISGFVGYLIEKFKI